MALVYAIVERGTFAINAYQDEQKSPLTWTNDKAFLRGYFYCDKPPGVSFAAVPIYALQWKARDWSSWLGRMPQDQWVALSRYVATLLTSALSGALLGCVLLALARRFGLSDRAGFVLSVGLLLGTVLAGYAALFYAYLPAALFTSAAYLLLLDARLKGGDALKRGWLLFWVGLLIGLAWFFDITSGLVGIALSLYAAWFMRRHVWAIWKLVVGGLIPVAVFCWYAHTIFGEFTIPYKYEFDDLFRTEMAKGFQGIHLPRLTTLYYLTIHPFKGLFFYSPFLLLTFAGIGMAFRRKKATQEERTFLPDVVLATGIIVAYFLYNSGYYMWWGGWAAGPRLLCPAIPYFIAPLALWLARKTPLRAGLFASLLTISVLFNFMILAVDPQIPTGIDTKEILKAKVSHNLSSAVLDDVIPRFCSGTMEQNSRTVNALSLNFGNLALGWNGKTALLPLAALWLAVAVWLGLRKQKE
ncbi:TPA: hypothetical protein DDW35_13600 [Candidatus Sumerlaeota bacterium]|nr:hypothetical protein [Candidatus Sumerlaeota bacterium]